MRTRTICFCLMILLGVPLWAQSRLTGTVKDSSGAVVPGVKW